MYEHFMVKIGDNMAKGLNIIKGDEVEVERIALEDANPGDMLFYNMKEYEPELATWGELQGKTDKKANFYGPVSPEMVEAMEEDESRAYFKNPACQFYSVEFKKLDIIGRAVRSFRSF